VKPDRHTPFLLREKRGFFPSENGGLRGARNLRGRVEICFLGTGDAVGSGGRFQTCILVQSGDKKFLIDCGASSLAAMKRFGVDPADIDRILVSHLHGDHFGGIPFFVLDAQFARRTRALPVAGPPGVESRVRDAMEVLFPGSSRVQRKFALEFLELQDRKQFLFGPLTVAPFAVLHPSGAPSHALRIRFEGKVIAYSGDTEWTEELVEAVRGADLFISEAYFFEKRIKYHLDYKTILEHRPQLGCRRIILTHMSRDMLDRLKELDLEWAEDGMVVSL
jgi:ribonuclease BN (tRNA processing enzyme)